MASVDLAATPMLRPMTHAADAPLLQLRDVSKGFGGVAVLRGIEMTLNRGEIVALLGENGAGKSTLKNILSGLIAPDSGEICFSGESFAALSADDVDRLGIGTIHQELSLFDNLTVAENIHMPHLLHRRGLVDWRRLTDESRRLLHDELQSDIDPGAAVATLSLGERQLVEIAKAMRRSSSVLILDEPTTCLSLPERERLFAVVRRLRARKYGIVYITHFLEEVYALADQVLVLRDGVITDRGTPADMPRDRITRSMVGRELAEMHITLPVVPLEAPVVLSARQVSDRTLVRDISFDLRRGEILGIAGLMGAGRSELAEVLIGLRDGAGDVLLEGAPYEARSPRRALERGLVLVSEDRRKDQAFLGRSLLENVTAPALPQLSGRVLGWLDRRRERLGAQELLQTYGVQPPNCDAPMISFSGGNQQKAIIGRWLHRQPRVCILDEPTKGVDIGARAAVHRLLVELAGKGVAFILISSDIPELLALSHRVLVLHKGRLAGEVARADLDASRLLRMASTGRDA